MNTNKYNPKLATLDEEIKQYESATMVSDAISFWRDNQNYYPVLAKIAKHLFCYQASSVPSERLFSSAGYTLWDRRASLSPHKLDKIIVLQHFLKTHSTDI